MSTMNDLLRCPKCDGLAIRHCSADPTDMTYSSACDLVWCENCHSYGTADGLRWAFRPYSRRDRP